MTVVFHDVKANAISVIDYLLQSARTIGRAALRRVKKKPLERQSEVIPKVNLMAVFEIPACRAPRGRPL